ncbi:hypothetical protein Unana1_05324 [Umbelopsis nana]
MSAISLITTSSSSHFSPQKHITSYRVDNDISRLASASSKSYSTEIIALKQKILSYEMEMQDTNREMTNWKRKCSELEASQQDLQLQYEARLQKMKTKFEEDAKRSRAVQVAKHDEALQMITQLREENQSLKDELNKQKLSEQKAVKDVVPSPPISPSESPTKFKSSLPDYIAIEAAYQNAVYKSSAYREPTDKLVNKINATVEALEYELGIFQQTQKEPLQDDNMPHHHTTEQAPTSSINEIEAITQKPLLKNANDSEVMQAKADNTVVNEHFVPAGRLVQSKSAMNLRSRALQDIKSMHPGQERRFNSTSAMDSCVKSDAMDCDPRMSMSTSTPLKTKSANSSPEPSLNKTPSPKHNLASHWLHRKRKSIADLKMEGIFRNEQVALRPSASLSTSELALRAESMAAQAMEANNTRESSTASREGDRRKTVSSVYGFDVTASSASFQQLRNMTPPPSPKPSPVQLKASSKPSTVDQVCEDVIPRANIDFEAMRHRSSMGGEYIQFQTSLSGSRRGSMGTPKALPQIPTSSMSTPYSSKMQSDAEAPLPTPTTSKTKWTRRRVVSALFKDSTD